MKRFFFCLALLASPAAAKDITVTLTEDEAKAAAQLIDLAVRAQGLAVADAAIAIVRKLNAAAQEAAQPEPKKEDPK